MMCTKLNILKIRKQIVINLCKKMGLRQCSLKAYDATRTKLGHLLMVMCLPSDVIKTFQTPSPHQIAVPNVSFHWYHHQVFLTR